MTWSTFHHRGEVLRTVTETADARLDGILPMDVTGVRETFGDELTLLGALQLRWHTHLSGRLERALLDRPDDLEATVVSAWQATAAALPGTRAVLDHYRAEPLDEPMAAAVATATAKEHVLLASMAGRAGADPEETAATGRELEQRARASYRPPTPTPTPTPTPAPTPAPADHRGPGLLARLTGRVSA